MSEPFDSVYFEASAKAFPIPYIHGPEAAENACPYSRRSILSSFHEKMRRPIRVRIAFRHFVEGHRKLLRRDVGVYTDGRSSSHRTNPLSLPVSQYTGSHGRTIRRDIRVRRAVRGDILRPAEH